MALSPDLYLSGSGVAPDGQYHWLRAIWQAEEAIRGSGLRSSIFHPLPSWDRGWGGR